MYIPLYLPPRWKDETQWQEILHTFTAVKNLYVCKEFARRIASTLQDLIGERERGTDVLPALESISLEGLQPSGPIQEDIGKFVSARQLSCRPITVSPWERDRI
jgi:hypothetical protein